jgi:hypothetical protein
MLNFLRHLQKNEDAVAYIEFALAFPILVIIACAGIEVTNLALVHVRLNHIAETAADNAARVRTQIDEADITNIFTGVSLVGAPIDFQNKGRVVLSSFQDNGLTGSNHGEWIRWQRCYGSNSATPQYGTEGTGKTNGLLANGVGAVGRRITAANGTAVLFAEVTYRYDPMIFRSFVPSRTLRYETAFNVRERTNFGITNTSGVALHSC